MTLWTVSCRADNFGLFWFLFLCCCLFVCLSPVIMFIVSFLIPKYLIVLYLFSFMFFFCYFVFSSDFVGVIGVSDVRGSWLGLGCCQPSQKNFLIYVNYCALTSAHWFLPGFLPPMIVMQ